MQRRKFKKYRLLPYITLILLTLGLLGIINFSWLSYTLNEEKYVKTEVKGITESVDGVVAIIPKVNFSYSFEGQDYTNSKLLYSAYFYLEDLQTISSIYVNKNSPMNFIVVRNFWDNYLNIFFTISIVLCLLFFINNLGKDVKVYNEKRKYKQEQRDNKERNRKQVKLSQEERREQRYRENRESQQKKDSKRKSEERESISKVKDRYKERKQREERENRKKELHERQRERIEQLKRETEEHKRKAEEYRRKAEESRRRTEEIRRTQNRK